MKKLILLIAFISAIIGAQAQDYYETATVKKISEAFVNCYNADTYRPIFNLYVPGLKTNFPLDNTTAFLEGVKSRAGKITSREFVKLEGPYAIYKATFERGTWTIRIGVDEEREQINGLYIFPYVDPTLPQLARNTTKLVLPFKGEWDVIWSEGEGPANYHNNTRNQNKALDMAITNSARKTYKTNGNDNADYYTFGAEVLAPCDGDVVSSADGDRDNDPGDPDQTGGLGNMLVIKTPNNEYLVFAHLKQHSIKVRPGQKVKQGELLAQCGNSGNSVKPHLHFHISNVPDQDQATGAKIYFDDIFVDGKLKNDKVLVKGDKVRNAK